MNKLIILSLLFLITSCTSNLEKSPFSEEINIDSFKSTDFVGTIENKFPEDKNIIYTPTLLFAWNEIKEKLLSIQLQNKSESSDLYILHHSETFKNSLEKNEYKTEIEIKDGGINSFAEFKLELSFDPKLQQLEYPLSFKHVDVEGFGMTKFDKEIANKIEIIYYKDNENFIFKIKPSQQNHELIFIKGLANEIYSFNKLLLEFERFKQLGLNEKNNPALKWKFTLNKNDSFEIPKLNFNIRKDYKTIEGESFKGNNVNYTIGKASQKIAFLLDENGAKIESEADVELKEIAALETDLNIKNLFLDNTFYLIAKHSNSSNPYFIAKIDNTELMNLITREK